jgi:peptide-methionine (R)-S-oxide reductase
LHGLLFFRSLFYVKIKKRLYLCNNKLKMLKHILVLIIMVFLTGIGCKSSQSKKETANEEIKKQPEQKLDPTIIEIEYTTNKRGDKIELLKLSDAEWMKKLSKEEYYVLRKKGTERAFSGAYWENKKEGLYSCAGCDQILFGSNAKFDSGTGWPSFFRADDDLMIKKATDNDLGYPRTEVMCGRCGGHLGHLFDDGPPPTGLRYCINSIALKFIEAKN